MLLHYVPLEGGTKCQRNTIKGDQDTSIDTRFLDFSLKVIGKDFKQGAFQRGHSIYSRWMREGVGTKADTGRTEKGSLQQ